MFNSLFKHLDDNNLSNSNQPGFRPGDSCGQQLLAIANDIYKAFDTNSSLEVKNVSLDLSKGFDRVWHKGLMYKLKPLGIYRKCSGLIHSSLSNRYQRFGFNGQSSYWPQVEVGVLQGSILEPLLFLVYKLFA